MHLLLHTLRLEVLCPFLKLKNNVQVHNTKLHVSVVMFKELGYCPLFWDMLGPFFQI